MVLSSACAAGATTLVRPATGEAGATVCGGELGMAWQQVYDPVGHVWASTLLAAVPVVAKMPIWCV